MNIISRRDFMPLEYDLTGWSMKSSSSREDNVRFAGAVPYGIAGLVIPLLLHERAHDAGIDEPSGASNIINMSIRNSKYFKYGWTLMTRLNLSESSCIIEVRWYDEYTVYTLEHLRIYKVEEHS